MFKLPGNTMFAFVSVVTLIVTLILLVACVAEPPNDIVPYCADSLTVYGGSAGKWRKIYTLGEEGKDQIITSLAYDATNNLVAISVADRMLAKGSVKIALIDPRTRKVIREITTGMDLIRGMAFDRTGKRLAVIVKRFKPNDPRKLYVMTLTDGSVQLLTEGDLLNLSWGTGDEIYLSYEEEGKRYVGSIDVGRKKSSLKKIAEGISINASNLRDAFVYIDGKGRTIYKEKGDRAQKILPLPPKFQDIRYLTSIKFVQNSDSIVISKYGMQWNNLYLFRPPYTDSQKILDRYNFFDYTVATKAQ